MFPTLNGRTLWTWDSEHVQCVLGTPWDFPGMSSRIKDGISQTWDQRLIQYDLGTSWDYCRMTSIGWDNLDLGFMVYSWDILGFSQDVP